ncbi:hypothetical protein JXA56_00350 [Candidatus Micrarchaeota archaeon]|nr:hypothetical protein [Candidatus Micrarchaeota archaeon]
MFDIICCEADPKKFGFAKFFSNLKIENAENLQEAAKFRNRKVLISLRDYSYDEGAVKLIAEKKNACFFIDLSRLIRSRGIPRAILMSKLRNFLRCCNRHGAYYAFASFAKTESEIRTASELCHIAMLFDITRGQAEFALKMIIHYQ